MSYESYQATWDKRFKARHYSYRDFHREAPITGTLADPSKYVFGTNAIAVNARNWPHLGDFSLATNTVAQEVKISCDTRACWIRFISYNPRYITLRSQGLSPDEVTGLGVIQYITELAQFLPANEQVTFYPSYAYSIEYWYDVVDSNIYIWIEGNAGGGE